MNAVHGHAFDEEKMMMKKKKKKKTEEKERETKFHEKSCRPRKPKDIYFFILRS